MSPVTRHASLVSFILNNSISFHQHNGEMTITSLFFNNIMERLISGIFSTFVFNKIMEVTFILPPPAFFGGRQHAMNLTRLISGTCIFCRVKGNLANYFYYHQHNGEREVFATSMFSSFPFSDQHSMSCVERYPFPGSRDHGKGPSPPTSPVCRLALCVFTPTLPSNL